MTPGIKRFIKYSSVGLSTFLFDLLLLYIFTDILLINSIVAAGLAFLIAVSVNYWLSRKYVFPGTLRGVKEGFGNFILIVLVGLAVVMGGMYVLVSALHFNYLSARIFTAALTGLWNYLMNLYVNFKVVGKH